MRSEIHSRANPVVSEGGSHSKLPSPIRHQDHHVTWNIPIPTPPPPPPRGELPSHPYFCLHQLSSERSEDAVVPTCRRGLLNGQDPPQSLSLRSCGPCICDRFPLKLCLCNHTLTYVTLRVAHGSLRCRLKPPTVVSSR